MMGHKVIEKGRGEWRCLGGQEGERTNKRDDAFVWV